MDKPHIVFSTDNYPLPLYFYGRIESKTPTGFKISVGPRNRVAATAVVARFDDEAEAQKLVQAIRGAKGEYDRHERAAREATVKAVAALIAGATK